MPNIVHLWVVVAWAFSGTLPGKPVTGVFDFHAYDGYGSTTGTEMTQGYELTERGVYMAPFMDRPFKSSEECLAAIEKGVYRVSEKKVSLGCEEHVIVESNSEDKKYIDSTN